MLETPGHTQGSISVWIPAENKLVAGDTLFLDSIGRTDLPGGNSSQILRSIHDKLLPLDDAVVVIPGMARTRPSAGSAPESVLARTVILSQPFGARSSPFNPNCNSFADCR